MRNVISLLVSSTQHFVNVSININIVLIFFGKISSSDSFTMVFPNLGSVDILG